MGRYTYATNKETTANFSKQIHENHWWWQVCYAIIKLPYFIFY